MNLAHQYQDGLIKLPVYDSSSLTKGQALIWGVDAGSYAGTILNTLINPASADDPIDIFAILAETPSDTTTANRNTPIVTQALCQIVENHKIFKIYYDLDAANDLDATGSSTTTSLAHATSDDSLDGGWMYINTGTGAGQLRYIKTATATTKVPNTAFTTSPDATSDWILIRDTGISIGGSDLDTSFTLLDSVLQGGGREILILKNGVEGGITGELNISDPDQSFEVDGLNSRGVRFYAYIMFLDTTFSATGKA